MLVNYFTFNCLSPSSKFFTLFCTSVKFCRLKTCGRALPSLSSENSTLHQPWSRISTWDLRLLTTKSWRATSNAERVSKSVVWNISHEILTNCEGEMCYNLSSSTASLYTVLTRYIHEYGMSAQEPNQPLLPSCEPHLLDKAACKSLIALYMIPRLPHFQPNQTLGSETADRKDLEMSVTTPQIKSILFHSQRVSYTAATRIKPSQQLLYHAEVQGQVYSFAELQSYVHRPIDWLLLWWQPQPLIRPPEHIEKYQH